MIRSFGNEAALSVWERRFRKGVPNDVMKVAHRKLTQLNSAVDLNDLRIPPATGWKRCLEIDPANTVSA